jgi:hypothetical protein
MQYETDLTGLFGRVALPLALFTQPTRTTTANAGVVLQKRGTKNGT